MTVGELLARITSAELTEWLAFYRLEPFGPERADLQAGIVASTVANANRDPKKQKQPFKPQDFMPQFEETKPARTRPNQDELKRKWQAVVAAFSGTGRKRES